MKNAGEKIGHFWNSKLSWTNFQLKSNRNFSEKKKGLDLLTDLNFQTFLNKFRINTKLIFSERFSGIHLITISIAQFVDKKMQAKKLDTSENPNIPERISNWNQKEILVNRKGG